MAKSGVTKVQSLCDYDLCYGCGVCVAVCPEECIEMQIQPPGIFRRTIDENRCTRCGRCVKVCPAVGFNTGMTKDIQASFMGYAKNENIRQEGTSGGVTTALLLYLLEQHHVDRVIVAGQLQATEFGMLGHCVLTNDAGELMAARGSLYAPMSIDRALKQVKDTPGTVAIVGLPCHLRGILNACEHIPEIGQKVVLTLGLVCHHIFSGQGVVGIAKILKFHEPLKSVRFREGKWPGEIELSSQKNTQRVPILRYLTFFSAYFGAAPSCLLCSDMNNEVAEISLSDPWLPRLRRPGYTLIAPRSDLGLQYLKMAEHDGYIALEQVETQAMRDTHEYHEFFKKRYLPYYSWRFLRFPKEAPSRHPVYFWGRLCALLYSWMAYLCLQASNTFAGRRIIALLPWKMVSFSNKFTLLLKLMCSPKVFMNFFKKWICHIK